MIITSFNRWLDISHCCFPIKKIPPSELTQLWTNTGKSPSFIEKSGPPVQTQWAKFHGADSQRLSISILYIPIGEIPILYIIVHPDLVQPIVWGFYTSQFYTSILYIPIGEIPLFEALEPTGTAVILPSGMDKPHRWTLIESPWGSRIRGFQEFLQPELNKKAATTY